MVKKCSLCVVIALLLVTMALAHPGKTDARGGHRDSSTGEYHYHHGYPAHQHTDLDGDGMPDCPYDFEDKTGESSGNSSSKDIHEESEQPLRRSESKSSSSTSSTSSRSHSPAYGSQGTASSESNADDSSGSSTIQFLAFCAAFVLFFFVIPSIIDKRRDRLHQLNSELYDLRKIHETETNKEEWKAVHRSDQIRLGAELSNQLSILSARAIAVQSEYHLPSVPSADEVSPLPDGCYIDSDGRPHTRGPIDRCTVYVATSGVYHLWRCYHAKSGTPCNIIDVKFSRPCRVCKPWHEIAWYTERMESEARLSALCEVLEYANHLRDVRSEGESCVRILPTSEAVHAALPEANTEIKQNAEKKSPTASNLREAEEDEKVKNSLLLQIIIIAIFSFLLLLRRCVGMS